MQQQPSNFTRPKKPPMPAPDSTQPDPIPPGADQDLFFNAGPRNAAQGGQQRATQTTPRADINVNSNSAGVAPAAGEQPGIDDAAAWVGGLLEGEAEAEEESPEEQKAKRLRHEQKEAAAARLLVQLRNLQNQPCVDSCLVELDALCVENGLAEDTQPWRLSAAALESADPRLWTFDDVAKWIKGFTSNEDVADIFRREAVDGETLLALSEADLLVVGVMPLGVRRQVMRGIAWARHAAAREIEGYLQQSMEGLGKKVTAGCAGAAVAPTAIGKKGEGEEGDEEDPLAKGKDKLNNMAEQGNVHGWQQKKHEDMRNKALGAAAAMEGAAAGIPGAPVLIHFATLLPMGPGMMTAFLAKTKI
eukprot:TRINITY_DN121542_c0_g1_i1.p1 TRINITY_DN121542_c0_g1~~TRINITY_DN121542_c0_g1_i1.p1  ORF type:complete len:361 (+),score=103.55 TRINITY_DN121542_c0_g1_i1:112-1194(+)